MHFKKDSMVVRDGLFVVLCIMGLVLYFTPLRDWKVLSHNAPSKRLLVSYDVWSSHVVCG